MKLLIGFIRNSRCLRQRQSRVQILQIRASNFLRKKALMDQVETSHTASSWRAREVFLSTGTGAQTSLELTWGPVALEQRRQRTGEHLARMHNRYNSGRFGRGLRPSSECGRGRQLRFSGGREPVNVALNTFGSKSRRQSDVSMAGLYFQFAENFVRWFRSSGLPGLA